jgi:hypothetical protein
LGQGWHISLAPTCFKALAIMTNTLAIILGLLLIGAACIDIFVYGTEHLLFLGKKLADLIEWIAFWR